MKEQLRVTTQELRDAKQREKQLKVECRKTDKQKEDDAISSATDDVERAHRQMWNKLGSWFSGMPFPSLTNHTNFQQSNQNVNASFFFLYH